MRSLFQTLGIFRMIKKIKLFSVLTALSLASTQFALALSDADIPTVSAPQFVVPGLSVPPEFVLDHSNNCVSIALHEGKLYMAWRNAPTHFAAKTTKMFVMSSPDMGATWDPEYTVALGSDVREPFLTSFKGNLIFTFFQGGSDPFQFKPFRMLRSIRTPDGKWSELKAWGTPGEVPWEIKVRNNRVYMTSYIGNHYSAGASTVLVHFSVSDDGLNFSPVDPDHPTIYEGGVSEVGFEFNDAGDVYAVTRNEDGDKTGFGSHVISSPNFGAGTWTIPAKSNPNRYDSPRMFKHGSELYLVARRDVGGPFDLGKHFLPFDVQKWLNLGTYSLRPKRTALYHVNQTTRSVEWIQDLPSAGDNAFPSIVQTGPDSFLVANYTSPLKKTRWSWIDGQLSKKGTALYLVKIDFKPANQ